MKHTTKTAEGHLQKELPDTIYLQLHGDNEYVGNNEEIDFGDVTWSEDRMYPTDVEYAKVKLPWISVKERLPEEGEPVLIRLKDGIVRLVCYDTDDDVNVYFWSDNYAYETISGWDVTHWTPIPSFDEILEANKDVLERIKQKGD